jgi:hypothetical protein
MKKEQLRMQMLSGIITESEYKEKIEKTNILNEGSMKYEKKFIEIALLYVQELIDDGWFGAGLETAVDDDMENVVYYLLYNDKKAKKNITKMLGYEPPKPNPPKK